MQATTHPFHYDSICLNGLGCDLAVPAGDRTLADFFAIGYDPSERSAVGRLRPRRQEAGRGARSHRDADGRLADRRAVEQRWHDRGLGTRRRPLVVDRSDRRCAVELLADRAGRDAARSADEERGGGGLHERDDRRRTPATGGFTVTLKVADLSTHALTQALADTAGQSLLWVWRFANGYQDSAASARWNPVSGFTFGWNDYTTGSTPCVAGTSTEEKCVVYPGNQPLTGTVDQATGTITLTVPASYLRQLGGADAARPAGRAAGCSRRSLLRRNGVLVREQRRPDAGHADVPLHAGQHPGDGLPAALMLDREHRP